MTDIGKTLQNARNEKHYTLDDLQQITKIQKRYLIAIEENNFDALPGDFYVRAFIRQYADTVGIKADKLLSELDEQAGKKKVEETEEEPTEAKTRTEAVRRQQQQSSTPSQVSQSFDKFMHYLPTIIIVGVVVIIIGSIYFVVAGNKKEANQAASSTNVSISSDVSSSKKSSKKESSSEEVSSSSSKKESSSSSESSKSSKGQKITNTAVSGSRFTYSLTSPAKKNKIKFTSKGGSAWSSISVNGTANWQGTLQNGASHTVTLPEGTTSFNISLGNSNVTNITINGKKFDFLKENSTLTVRQITVNVANE
ncbi:helix-turn-helix domain-containing protein [Ligilactobacillus salivarius]|uniref:helix-turn-helix domain-containing protein n=1 Tax=Ligilactobacillus salivarius TaxID=1624 RepID=UPI00237EC3A3|nr:helix-turn-helix domain-containing protein [Ligilactobacillus salivarius]MDE1499445.1 DUF4115 domain-containing protein [Ligilactobacillus salivarius]MDE1542555.1 DUF4115 domain-containing protein [Ligilactobacillus salivarius]